LFMLTDRFGLLRYRNTHMRALAPSGMTA